MRRQAQHEGVIGLFLIAIGLVLLLLFFTGCTRFQAVFGKAQHRTEVAQRAVDHDTKKAVTASVEAIRFAEARLPTNTLPEVVNALRIGIKYGEMAQRGVGLPVERVDVVAEVHGEKKAVEAARKLEAASALRVETRDALADAELARLKALAELGAKYEEERNQNIVKRTWRWLMATFGVGGIIALCIFFPALIPIIGRILGWIVAKIPQLAGFIGVVATKAVDKIVGTVEVGKRKSKAAEFAIEQTGSKMMDESEKALVRVRKPVVMDKIKKQEEKKAALEERVDKVAEETEEIQRKSDASTIGGPAAKNPIGSP